MKNALRLLVATVMLLVTAPAVHAQTANNPVLQRLGVTDLPVIHAQKGFSTLIEFPADHKIVEVTCGEKEFWVVEGMGRFLHVKPAKEGIVTNLNVLTEGDIVYAFILKEVSGPAGVTARADLQVIINPAEDLALAASLQESERLRVSLAQSQRAVAEANQKYQAERDKNAARDVAARQTPADSLNPRRHAAGKPKAKNPSGPGR
jgi:conjugative transfer protein CagX